MIKYGILLGRFQPFHIGHQSIVEEIIKDNLKPIIIIGSANKFNTDKNPLIAAERELLIRKIYPGIKILFLDDNDNWDDWVESLIDILVQNDINPKETKIYIHVKDKDKTDFEFNNKKYFNAHWIEILKESNFSIKYLEDFKIDGKTIHSTSIRKNKEYAERVLNEKVYNFLKNKDNWWI